MIKVICKSKILGAVEDAVHSMSNQIKKSVLHAFFDIYCLMIYLLSESMQN